MSSDRSRSDRLARAASAGAGAAARLQSCNFIVSSAAERAAAAPEAVSVTYHADCRLRGCRGWREQARL